MLIQPILFPPSNLINEPDLFFRDVPREEIKDTNNDEETEHIIVDADETNYDAFDETEIGLPY